MRVVRRLSGHTLLCRGDSSFPLRMRPGIVFSLTVTEHVIWYRRPMDDVARHEQGSHRDILRKKD